MDKRKIDRHDEDVIDLSRFIIEFRDMLLRFFWIPLALAVISAAFLMFNAWRSYIPMYSSEATFTIQLAGASDSDLPGSYSDYDKATAEQLGATFPYLIQSNLMYSKLCRAMGVSSINGIISAQTVQDTNLFTIKVVSSDPKAAKEILEKVIEVYPQVADYVIGNTSMDLLTQPDEADEPYNRFDPISHVIKGAVAGLVVGMAVLAVFAAARKTVRNSEDVRMKLNQNCLAALPKVTLKKRTKQDKQLAVISNRHIPGMFQESVRGLKIKLMKLLPDDGKCKVLLVTSTMPGEGKTTVAANLALSLSQNGERVILADLDLRNPSVKKSMGITEPSRGQLELLQLAGTSLRILAGDTGVERVKRSQIRRICEKLNALRDDADYIIMDTPPCGLLADSLNVADAADYTIYVVGSNKVESSRIIDSMQFLAESGANIIGCVVNGVESNGKDYGYGYGYGYGYSRYKSAYDKGR